MMRRSRAGGTRLVVALIGAAVAMALFAVPASAHKTHLFIETFGSAAQPAFEGSNALAVDQSSGDLLVADSGLDTISRYKPNGEPDPFPALGTNVIDAKKGEGGKACAEEASSCDLNPEHPGFLFGGFAGEEQVAVDNSGAATDGDIYVTGTMVREGVLHFVNFVDIFAPDGHYLGQLTAAGSSFENICGVTVDPGGNVFLAEYGKFGVAEPKPKIYKFVQPGSPHNPLENADGGTFTIPPNQVCNLAAGAGPSAGALFGALYGFNEGILKFNAASGALEGTIDPGRTERTLGVDPVSGHLFTSGREFTASGTLVSVFDSRDSRGIAIDGAADRVYTSSSQNAGGGVLPSVRVLGPLVTLPDVSTGSYEIEGDTAVRIEGSVNPDGEALTECFFEYETDAARKEHSFEPFKGATAQPCEAPNAAEVGSGTSPVEVHADLTELGSETLYHYRLVATNPNAALYPNDPEATVKGLDQAFKTPSKPGIKALWAEDVTTADATLKATLNPENSPTTYRFEYGDQGPCSANPCARVPALPAPEPSIGSGGSDHTVGFVLHDLEPGTAYHYRLVATNGIGTTEAADHLLRTFAVPTPPSLECENEASRIGAAAFLPDCRAYEMVSPVDKDGGDIRLLKANLGALAVVEQSAESGEKLAYGSIRSFGDAASAPFTSQYIAQRIEGAEWQTHSINSPRESSVIDALAQFDTEFKAFSADLCQAWQTTFAEPPLASGGVEGYENLYQRTDELCGEDGIARYEALAPLVEPQAVPAGAFFSIEPTGFSSDGADALFVTTGKLTAEGTDGKSQLYESTPGALHLVCVLPDRAPLRGNCRAGSGESPTNNRRSSLTGDISSDGSHVFWSTSASGAGKLYVRLNPDQPESARLHGAATGKGDLIGPASGTGNVLKGSALVKGTKAESGAFAVGQKISDSGGAIPAGATIVKIEETAPGVFTLTLSAAANANKLGDSLTGQASETVLSLSTESGAFQAGQEISAAGIPPGTTVLSCSPSCGEAATSLTLSVKASKTETAAALSATSPCTEADTKACTIPVSEAAEEAAGTNGSWFWGAAADGSKAIFTTGDLSAGQATLYSFEVDSQTTTPIVEGVFGVMGMSEDADRVYFASKEVLSEEANSNGDKAQAGEPNLYLHEAGGGTKFVGTLAAGDLGNAVAREALEHTSRVAPDGLHAAFESVEPLSGYDNKAGRSGQSFGLTYAPGDAIREIYRYDAGTKQLTCVSCSPSGERPNGLADIPHWETGMHAARVLVDDGSRLYFESADALTPRDTNGTADVYQWEAPGTGSCEESSPTYSPQDEGCVDLVSSGQSRLDSRFVESDPSGDNVFIATASSLLPQDPGGVDIYDARVNGGLPIPQGPPPSCEGEACQGVTEAPNDPTPASLSFEGAGNVREEPAAQRPKPCAKGKVKRHGKCVAKVRHERNKGKQHKHRAKHHRKGTVRP